MQITPKQKQLKDQIEKIDAKSSCHGCFRCRIRNWMLPKIGTMDDESFADIYEKSVSAANAYELLEGLANGMIAPEGVPEDLEVITSIDHCQTAAALAKEFEMPAMQAAYTAIAGALLNLKLTISEAMEEHKVKKNLGLQRN